MIFKLAESSDANLLETNRLFAGLPTERADPRLRHLDTLPVGRLLNAILAGRSRL